MLFKKPDQFEALLLETRKFLDDELKKWENHQDIKRIIKAVKILSSQPHKVEESIKELQRTNSLTHENIKMLLSEMEKDRRNELRGPSA